TLQLTTSSKHTLEDLRRWLGTHGFRAAELVAEPGQYASRGGIVDVFPPASPQPYRIEFFGDEIESIRTFDVTTQRSLEERSNIAVTACASPEDGGKANRSLGRAPASMCLLEYLPPDSLVLWHEPLEIAEVGRSFVTRIAGPVGICAFESVAKQRMGFKCLEISSFAVPEGTEAVPFHAESLPSFSGKAEAVRDEVAELAAENDVMVFCDNDAELERLESIFSSGETSMGVDSRIKLGVGLLQHGFILGGAGRAANTAVVTNHELFHRYRERRRFKPRIESRPIDSFTELERGNYIVHAVHGIGRYLGLKVLKSDGRKEDTLVLQYRDNVKVYVPAPRIDLVQKYIGGFKGRPQLARIGGKAWAAQKRRVAMAVEELAADILHMQAVRNSQSGMSYPPDTLWQREFEASFIYTETPDQLAVLEEMKKDMQSSRPMDRLLCGDVGYGKTELAIRIAFKAVEAGKQVAVLVPTTVLAEQHWRTFTERMADYPFIIDCLSRFKTKKEQTQILERVRKGATDILIGTHRIIQSDVRFADLGLVIIDEEQRFGVEHKERLKRLRQTVDVLTMTATPIPRTLHMSLMGIRDISSLSTPPLDRRSIHTEVCPYDPRRIRQAILRELSREGQVFFVHNRVHNIKGVAQEIEDLVPEARVTFAHGQMPERELRSRMIAFFDHEIDVLVTTTIIESGLDIPTANTMFINVADRFGLAELHQLRGRIGRYKHRAFCYLLLPADRPLTPTAAQRLQAIQQYAELGAGFRIAMRDLEIRGAGNILGKQQSGHIATVGYEMYCRLLASAVQRAQGSAVEESVPVDVSLNLSQHIPRTYVPSESQQIAIYRQLGRAGSVDVLEEIRSDFIDIYGPIPDEVDVVLDLARVRVLSAQRGISSITLSSHNVIFKLSRAWADDEFLGRSAPGEVRLIDAHTVCLHLEPDKSQPRTVLAMLKNILADSQGDR
ncbi:MAG: transcription-repair coupling factor, partial [Planctomycetia bacterium]|nr:transcription-repair coupling factor [Planctomycetia bacterium]